MQDICKAQNETVEIDSNKSVTATNVKRLIPQINRDYQTFKKRKCNDKILISIRRCKKIERKKME